MEELRMPYKRYKERYADCETVRGTYDKDTRTIVVLVPDGRMKASGVRGKRYSYYRFHGVMDGRTICVPIKAINVENARKQLKQYYPGAVFEEE